MSKETRVSNPIYSFLPMEVEGFDSLAELALDMHFYWNHSADEVWRQLDPALWELTYNPWVVLQTVSRDRIELLSADPVFHRKVEDLLEAKLRGEESPAWFQQNHGETPLAGNVETLEEDMRGLPDYRLWECRASASPRGDCLPYARCR